MEKNEHIELLRAQDTPELRRLAETWKQAATQYDCKALDDAEERLRQLASCEKRIPMQQWKALAEQSGCSESCLLPATELPAGFIYICLPTTDYFER